MKTLTTTSTISDLTTQLTKSLSRPGRKTLTLINKALSYLTPFESPKASVTSSTEKRELLDLLNTHRQLFSPYLDTDRIEAHLLHHAAPY